AVSDTVNSAGAASTLFPQSSTTAAAGPALNLSGLSAATGLHLSVSDVRYDSTANLYTANLRPREDGAGTGRQVAVVFPGLPAVMQLQIPSGMHASGNPYLSFANAIPDGGLGKGNLSEPIQVVFSDPNRVRFA